MNMKVAAVAATIENLLSMISSRRIIVWPRTPLEYYTPRARKESILANEVICLAHIISSTARSTPRDGAAASHN